MQPILMEPGQLGAIAYGSTAARRLREALPDAPRVPEEPPTRSGTCVARGAALFRRALRRLRAA